MIKLRHAGIVVKDVEESLRFYEKIMGLKIVSDRKEKGEFINIILGTTGYYVRTIKLSDKNGVVVELLKFPLGSTQIKRIDTVGCSHVAFTVDNLEELYARCLREDVWFNSSPQKTPDEKCLVVFCKDPNGVFVELVEELQ